MSGKRKQDYIGVFSATQAFLPAINVKTVTLDFEAAMWQAVAEVFPTVTRLGCFFHWSQAIWRKVQELGLQTASFSKIGPICSGGRYGSDKSFLFLKSFRKKL